MKFPHLGKSSGTEEKRPGGFGTLMINDSPLDHSEVFSLLNSQCPGKRQTIYAFIFMLIPSRRIKKPFVDI